MGAGTLNLLGVRLQRVGRLFRGLVRSHQREHGRAHARIEGVKTDYAATAPSSEGAIASSLDESGIALVGVCC